MRNGNQEDEFSPSMDNIARTMNLTVRKKGLAKNLKTILQQFMTDTINEETFKEKSQDAIKQAVGSNTFELAYYKKMLAVVIHPDKLQQGNLKLSTEETAFLKEMGLNNYWFQYLDDLRNMSSNKDEDESEKNDPFAAILQLNHYFKFGMATYNLTSLLVTQSKTYYHPFRFVAQGLQGVVLIGGSFTLLSSVIAIFLSNVIPSLLTNLLCKFTDLLSGGLYYQLKTQKVTTEVDSELDRLKQDDIEVDDDLRESYLNMKLNLKDWHDISAMWSSFFQILGGKRFIATPSPNTPKLDRATHGAKLLIQVPLLFVSSLISTVAIGCMNVLGTAESLALLAITFATLSVSFAINIPLYTAQTIKKGCIGLFNKVRPKTCDTPDRTRSLLASA